MDLTDLLGEEEDEEEIWADQERVSPNPTPESDESQGADESHTTPILLRQKKSPKPSVPRDPNSNAGTSTKRRRTRKSTKRRRTRKFKKRRRTRKSTKRRRTRKSKKRRMK